MKPEIRKTQFIFFDLETIPDEDLILSIYPKKFHAERLKGGQTIESYEEILRLEQERKQSENVFFPPPFQKIVSLGLLWAGVDDNGQVKVQLKATDPQKDEEHHLGAFWYYLGWCCSNASFYGYPFLVSYNGNKFDLPTLFLRSLNQNFETCWQDKDRDLIKKGLKEYFNDSDKWENNRPNYSKSFSKFNLDLMNLLASCPGGLKTLCHLCGISLKEEGEGSEVRNYFLDGQFEKIQNYVKEDVIGTAKLFLKYWNLGSALDPKMQEICQSIEQEIDNTK